MEIVHIVLGKANPNRMNGVNKVAHYLATAQIELGHRVNIFGLSNSPETERVDRSYCLKLFKRKKLNLDKNLKREIELLNKENTVFHLHGGFIIDFYFISKFLARKNFRYIFTSHGSYNKIALQKSQLKKKIFFHLFDKTILKCAWKVQFLGQSEYKHIDSLVQGIPKVLIPNGQSLIDLEFNKCAVEYKETSAHPVFGFLGRIDIFHKGLDILMEGFLTYKQKGGKGTLHFIGNGPDLPWLKSFVLENDLNNYVIFFGSQFGEKKLHLISNLDVFVHTSRFEGFPMAVLEAAGLKKPLLISKETNFAEYVRQYNNGIVLGSNIPIEVTKELFFFETAFYEKTLSKMADNSMNMIEEKFAWRKISQLLIEG